MLCIVFAICISLVWCQVCPEMETVETFFPSKIEALYWHEQTNVDLIFATTYGKNPTVWRSTDDGKSWLDLRYLNRTVKFPNNTFPGNNSFHVLNILDGWIAGEIFFVGINGDMWYTNDGGNNITYYSTNFINNLIVHPYQPGWLLALENSPCTGEFVYFLACYTMHFSSDYANSWIVLQDQILEASWGLAGISVPVGSVYALKLDWENNIYHFDYVYTTNLFNTSIIVEKTYDFLTSDGGPVFLLRILDGIHQSLWISSDYGLTFNQLYFPGSENEDIQGFSIIDINNGSLLYGVAKYINPGYLVTDIYFSDTYGLTFDLSLPNVVVNGLNIELEEVGNLPGIYIANTFIYNNESNLEIVTLITYDYGTVWYHLNPPPGSSCSYSGASNFCTLNLRGNPSPGSSNYEGLKVGAVGLIIGNGQVGPGLSDSSPDELYMSMDAGLTWRTIFPAGEYVYEFGNHGTIILVLESGDDVVNNSQIHYSLNYGQDFKTCSLPNPANNVNAIYGQLNEVNRGFFMVSMNDQTKEYKIIYLDFEQALSRTCNQSDFEIFTPTSPTGQNCLLGETYQVTRRKPGADCSVPIDYIGVETNNTCNCTVVDFRCETCYMREPFSYSFIGEVRDCAWFCSPESNPFTPPSECFLPDGNPNKIVRYKINGTSPYKKNIASHCQGGLDLVNDPSTFWVGCPVLSPDIMPSSISPEDSNTYLIILLSLIVPFFVLGVLLVGYFSSPKIKQFFIEKWAMSYGKQKEEEEVSTPQSDS